MLRIDPTDLSRMREQLLFDGPEAGRKLTAFWTLLLLAAVIASAGVVGDSTATVIGAMIVAPLMTPILGTVLSIVSGDVKNLARCALLVVLGAAAVIAIGWVLGHAVTYPVVADSNGQVAARVHPRVIDLVAALATGAVGSYALIRSDVSDTLPGVAIAISLVPPLAVVGLTLESGRPHQAAGAMLLFLTNVAAILLSGLAVMALYRVRRTAESQATAHLMGNRAATLLVAACVVALVIPLAATSRRVAGDERQRADVAAVARPWAAAHGWEILSVEPGPGGTVVHAIGPAPAPKPESLRAALDAAGLRHVAVRVDFADVVRADLPAS